jgi:hypothetical protein
LLRWPLAQQCCGSAQEIPYMYASTIWLSPALTWTVLVFNVTPSSLVDANTNGE